MSELVRMVLRRKQPRRVRPPPAGISQAPVRYVEAVAAQGTYLAVDLPPGTDEAPFVEVLGPLAQAGALHREIDT